jgi:hypothetical protein
MTTHNYTAVEMGPLTDVQDIIRRAIAHGYTGIGARHTIDADGDNYTVIINEGDDKATTKANLDAATVPILSLSTYDLQVSGDGVATGNVTVSDSRGASAVGKIVSMRVSNLSLLSPSPTVTLDAAGQAVVTFGPSPSAGTIIRGIRVPFYYASREAAEVIGEFSYV